MRARSTAHPWLVLVAVAAPPSLATCTREADLPDPPGWLSVPTSTGPAVRDAASLDVGLGADALGVCGERPEGNCRGPIDFTCRFDGWVDELAVHCQRQTGCRTNGWVRGEMGDDGCATDLGMSAPSAEFAACMAAELGAFRCPCSARSHTSYLGDGHSDAGC